MNKGAVIYIAKLLAERFIGAALFFVAAGSFDIRSGFFFRLYIDCDLFCRYNLSKKYSEEVKYRLISSVW